MKSSILFYTDYWIKTGMERVLISILPELKRYYNIFLVTNKSLTKESFSLLSEINHIVISDEKKARIPQLLLDIVKRNYVQAFVGNCNSIEYIYDIYEIMISNGIKTIAFNHEYFFYPCARLDKCVIMEKRQAIFTKLTATVWLTRFSAYLGQLHYNNAVYIPNPTAYDVDNTIVKNNHGRQILCVGRFNSQNKRIDRALKVFRRVIERVPDASLTIVGKYDKNTKLFNDQSVNDIIEKLKFPQESTIEWIGEVTDPSLYYKKASILMLVSENEGFGLVLNEAASFGTPSVVFDILGLEDIIIDGKNGYIIPQDHIEEMADKICELLENENQLVAMQQCAKEYARRFEKETVVARWRQLLDSVIKCNGDFDRSIKAVTEVPMERIEGEYRRIILNIIKELKSYGEKIEDYNLEESDFDKLRDIFNQVLDSIKKLQIKIFRELPLSNEKKVVGIYGSGYHTEFFLKKYRQCIGEIKAKIVIIDTYKETFSSQWSGYDIYNVKDIDMSHVSEIIISSTLYEEEMYDKVKELYSDRFKVYKYSKVI